MAIGVNQYPIQASPVDVSGSLAKGIAMKLADLQAQKAKAELPFVPLTARANAASKLAFAALSGPQQAVGLVKSGAYKNYPEDVQKTILDMAANAPFVMNTISNLISGNPQQEQKQQPRSLSGDIGDMIGGGLGAVGGLGKDILNYITGSGGESPEMRQGQSRLSDSIGSMIGGNAGGVPNRMGATSPASNIAKFTTESEVPPTRAKEETKIEATQFGDLKKDAQAQSLAAQQLAHKVNSFHELYKKSSMVGPVVGGGFLSKLGRNSSQLEPLSSDLVISMANQLYGSRDSDAKNNLVSGSKLNASMGEDAEKGTYERLISATNRVKQYGTFVNVAKQAGIKDPDDVKQYWYDMNEEMPYYDDNKLKPITANQNISKTRMKEFIQDKMESASNNADEMPDLNKSLQEVLDNFDTQEEFQDWLKGLSPEQRDFVKQHVAKYG